MSTERIIGAKVELTGRDDEVIHLDVTDIKVIIPTVESEGWAIRTKVCLRGDKDTVFVTEDEDEVNRRIGVAVLKALDEASESKHESAGVLPPMVRLKDRDTGEPVLRSVTEITGVRPNPSEKGGCYLDAPGGGSITVRGTAKEICDLVAKVRKAYLSPPASSSEPLTPEYRGETEGEKDTITREEVEEGFKKLRAEADLYARDYADQKARWVQKVLRGEMEDGLIALKKKANEFTKGYCDGAKKEVLTEMEGKIKEEEEKLKALVSGEFPSGCWDVVEEKIKEAGENIGRLTGDQTRDHTAEQVEVLRAEMEEKVGSTQAEIELYVRGYCARTKEEVFQKIEELRSNMQARILGEAEGLLAESEVKEHRLQGDLKEAVDLLRAEARDMERETANVERRVMEIIEKDRVTVEEYIHKGGKVLAERIVGVQTSISETWIDTKEKMLILQARTEVLEGLMPDEGSIAAMGRLSVQAEEETKEKMLLLEERVEDLESTPSKGSVDSPGVPGEDSEGKIEVLGGRMAALEATMDRLSVSRFSDKERVREVKASTEQGTEEVKDRLDEIEEAVDGIEATILRMTAVESASAKDRENMVESVEKGTEAVRSWLTDIENTVDRIEDIVRKMSKDVEKIKEEAGEEFQASP